MGSGDIVDGEVAKVVNGIDFRVVREVGSHVEATGKRSGAKKLAVSLFFARFQINGDGERTDGEKEKERDTRSNDAGDSGNRRYARSWMMMEWKERLRGLGSVGYVVGMLRNAARCTRNGWGRR